MSMPVMKDEHGVDRDTGAKCAKMVVDAFTSPMAISHRANGIKTFNGLK